MIPVVKTIDEARQFVKKARGEGKTIGLVPTMGFLHEGHKSLIVRAAAENDCVVVSVFVNPTQFAPNEDFEQYPRDIEKDTQLCTEAGADIIFNPEPEQMYSCAKTTVSVAGLTAGLCGKSRPTHFNGVCTVVAKLFNIVKPDRAYFGEKDAQQLMVIKKMVRDLDFDIRIIGCPIVRESDGLAKSSRNTYLNDDERKAALCLSRSLGIGRSLIESGQTDTRVIADAIRAELSKEPLAVIDYVELVSPDTLEHTDTTEGGVLAAIAVYIGKTRLIDNFIIERGNA